MNILDAAILIAIEAHGGDRNKHDGEMYLMHLARVAMNVRDNGGDEVYQAVAWLHDSIEDTSLTPKELEEKLNLFTNMEVPRICRKVVSAVETLTKIKGETNEDYYYRVKQDVIARFVKFYGDIKDNFRRNHKIKDDATRLRMAAKYSLGMDILG